MTASTNVRDPLASRRLYWVPKITQTAGADHALVEERKTTSVTPKRSPRTLIERKTTDRRGVA